jgi:hypothetical protein
MVQGEKDTVSNILLVSIGSFSLVLAVCFFSKLKPKLVSLCQYTNAGCTLTSNKGCINDKHHFVYGIHYYNL